MLESSLTYRLLTDATVSGLVSTRIYPLVLPETMLDPNTDTPPSITYRTISDVPNYTLSGQRLGSKTRVEFNSWASDYADVKTTAAAIQASLEGFSGQLGDVAVQFIEAGGVNTDGFDQDSRLYRVQQDLFIYHA